MNKPKERTSPPMLREFFDLCGEGDVQGVWATLAAGADPNARDDKGRTPLIYAGLMCDTKERLAGIVRALLDAGADVNATDDNGVTPLMYIPRQDSVEAIRMLLDAGADVNATDDEGMTPLMYIAGDGLAESVRMLLDAGADVNAADDDGMTPLMFAAETGNAAVFRALLDAGADPDREDRFGDRVLDYVWGNKEISPLPSTMLRRFGAEGPGWLYAAGDAEGVRAALARGANPNAMDDRGRTVLMYAVRDHPLAVLKALLDAGTLVPEGAPMHERVSVDARDKKDGNTALLWALRFERAPDVIEALLAAGVDVDARDAHGETALWKAAGWMSYPEAVKALIAGGADVNVRNASGKTPLMEVLDFSGWDVYAPDVVEMLLEAGADVNLTTGDGARAVDLAWDNSRIFPLPPDLLRRLGTDEGLLRLCAANTPEDVQAALANGADANAKDDRGRTALMYAARDCCPEVVAALVEGGADVNARDVRGKTALNWALGFSDHAGVITALLDAGVDVNTRDNSGMTALLWAAWLGRWSADVIGALLRAGADLNARNPRGMTALMWAVIWDNDPATVKLLIDAGADPTVRDDEGKSALDHARENDARQEVLAMLSEAINQAR